MLEFITPPKVSEAIQVGLINDTYKEGSIKGGTRKERGKSGPRVRIEGFDQQGSKWQDFLNRGEYGRTCAIRRKVPCNKRRNKLLRHPHIETAGLIPLEMERKACFTGTIKKKLTRFRCYILRSKIMMLWWSQKISMFSFS